MNGNTPNEIVKELRIRADTQAKRGYKKEAEELIEVAAIIESLTTQLATKTTLLNAAIAGQESLQSEITRQDEKIARLTEERDESQRREKAAVEDINLMADGVPCDVCKHKDKTPCANKLNGNCFEWREEQVGEK